MKRIILFILFTLGFLSFAAAQDGTLKVTGEIANLGKGSVDIYLSSNLDVKADSAAFEDGRFELSCRMDLPQFVYIYIKDTKEELAFIGRIFTDAGHITLKGDKEKGKMLQVEGAPLNDELNGYFGYVKTLPEYKENGRLSGEISEAFKVGDKKKVNELTLLRHKNIRKIIDAIFAWKNDAARNIAAAFQICEYASSLPLEDQIKTAKRFPASMEKKSRDLRELKANIESEKKLKTGSVAPDFKVKDLAGKEYTLADFKGKYIYLEFSASWCGWCKKEVPYIRTAYHALKDKNIVFITMNMDTAREKWEGDITKENIEWMCLSNLEGMKSTLAESYNVHGIPACFVIDPQGKIIKRDIRGNEVIEYLSGLF